MRYKIVVWLCFVLVKFRQGLSQEVGNVEEEEEDPYSRQMPALMENLHRVFNGKTENLHAEVNKRSNDRDKRFMEAEDPYYQHMPQMMEDLHRVFSGKTENLHAEFNKRSNDRDERFMEAEDPYTQHMPQLMADLHRVFSGKTENLHAVFNKRSNNQDERDIGKEQRYTQSDEEEEEEDDPYSQHMSQLMADLHQVFSGKTENLHAEFNKRFAADAGGDKRFAELNNQNNVLQMNKDK